MHRKKIIYISNRGAPAPRRLAPGLLGLALLAPCLPASAQPAEGRPCDQIAEACRQAGFVFGAVKSGNGLLVDCVRPIMQNKPQPLSATRPLPQIDPQLVAACKANNPDFGQAGAAPPSAPAAVTGTGGDDEFEYNGDTYGWYEDGWNGAGWYIVGYEFRRGFGYGGGEGWHSWHHHGSHAHRDEHHEHHEEHHEHHEGHHEHHEGHHEHHEHHEGHHEHHGGGHHGGGGRHGGGHHKSDIRLKHDIVMLGQLDNGLGFYRFSYNGSEKAYVGVMAQEVQVVMPEAVVRGSDGHLLVNYDRLGIRMQTWDAWVASGQKIPSTAPVRH
jgi:hypothetical protein